MVEYHFSDWRLNTEQQCLYHEDGRQEILAQRTFLLLQCFIESPSAVLSKEQLIEKLWPNTIVTDNSLNQLIVELRKILGDDAKSPIYIKTVPKKGFVFIPRVFEGEKPKSSKKWPYFGFCLFAIILVSLSSIIPFSQEKIDELMAPNGSAVAYFTEDGQDIYLNIKFHDEFKAPMATRIHHPSTRVMAWSFDSRRVVYNATQDIQPFYSLNVLDLDTGKTSYFKSPKAPKATLEETLPDTFDKATELTNHEVQYFKGRSVASIDYSESESFTVLFEEGKVVSIQWQLKN